MPTFAVILPAAGSSRRFHDQHYKKPFAPLAGRSVWMYAAEKFWNRPDVKQVIMIVAPEDREGFLSKFGANLAIMGVELAHGGKERSDSVQNALARVKSEIEYVAIHDAARPCIAEAWITDVFAAAVRTGAAMLAVPITGTLKKVRGDHTIEATVSRDNLWEAQTPQVFRRQLLIDAYARRGQHAATDDAQLVEHMGHAVTVVTGSAMNIKITTKEDLRIAEALFKALPKPKLIGPAHPFEGDDMWR